MNAEYNPSQQNETPRTVYVDAHVHLYDAALRDDLLSAASANVARLASADGRTAAHGVLLLADPDGVDGFGWLSRLPDTEHSSDARGGWRVAGRPDAHTLHLRQPGATPLTVVGGHQAITEEKLEVLIFPKIPRQAARATLAATLDEARAHGAIAILPWGAGKWLGHRGQLVDGAIAARSPAHVCVADNGGRWQRPGRVARLEAAMQRGFPCLSGTDPLPIDGEHRRVGSFGVRIETPIDTSTPGGDVLAALMHGPVAPVGARLPMTRFFRNQLALRLA